MEIRFGPQRTDPAIVAGFKSMENALEKLQDSLTAILGDFVQQLKPVLDEAAKGLTQQSKQASETVESVSKDLSEAIRGGLRGFSEEAQKAFEKRLEMVREAYMADVEQKKDLTEIAQRQKRGEALSDIQQKYLESVAMSSFGAPRVNPQTGAMEYQIHGQWVDASSLNASMILTQMAQGQQNVTQAILGKVKGGLDSAAVIGSAFLQMMSPQIQLHGRVAPSPEEEVAAKYGTVSGGFGMASGIGMGLMAIPGAQPIGAALMGVGTVGKLITDSFRQVKEAEMKLEREEAQYGLLAARAGETGAGVQFEAVTQAGAKSKYPYFTPEQIKSFQEGLVKMGTTIYDVSKQVDMLTNNMVIFGSSAEFAINMLQAGQPFVSSQQAAQVATSASYQMHIGAAQRPEFSMEEREQAYASYAGMAGGITAQTIEGAQEDYERIAQNASDIINAFGADIAGADAGQLLYKFAQNFRFLFSPQAMNKLIYHKTGQLTAEDFRYAFASARASFEENSMRLALANKGFSENEIDKMLQLIYGKNEQGEYKSDAAVKQTETNKRKAETVNRRTEAAQRILSEAVKEGGYKDVKDMMEKMYSALEVGPESGEVLTPERIETYKKALTAFASLQGLSPEDMQAFDPEFYDKYMNLNKKGSPQSYFTSIISDYRRGKFKTDEASRLGIENLFPLMFESGKHVKEEIAGRESAQQNVVIEIQFKGSADMLLEGMVNQLQGRRNFAQGNQEPANIH